MVVCGERDDHFREVIDEARVFFRSFQAVNKARPVFVLHTTKERIADVMELEEEYERMEFVIIDPERYRKAGKNDPRYYKLEAYDMQDDNIFVFDTDFIWLKNIDNLFGWSAPIAMCHEPARGCFNSGLVAINKARLPADIYKILLNHPHDGGYGNDQNILNGYFGRSIHRLDAEYNQLVLNVQGLDNVAGLHLILKPWYQQHLGRCNALVTSEAERLYRHYGGIYA